MVVDRGDLPRVRFRPDRGHPQNLAAVVEVARSAAEALVGGLRWGLYACAGFAILALPTVMFGMRGEEKEPSA